MSAAGMRVDADEMLDLVDIIPADGGRNRPASGHDRGASAATERGCPLARLIPA